MFGSRQGQGGSATRCRPSAAAEGSNARAALSFSCNRVGDARGLLALPLVSKRLFLLVSQALKKPVVWLACPAPLQPRQDLLPQG